MDPEQRLLVIHKYLAVKCLILFLGAVLRLFEPQRGQIVDVDALGLFIIRFGLLAFLRFGVGGGLISGIALAVKTMRPEVKIIGVSPVGSLAMKISLEEKHVTRLSAVKTSAEGVAVRQPGDLTFALAGKYVDEIITITEKDIMEAVLTVLEKHKLIAETAGVVPLAGVKKRAKPGKKIVCLMSGGNIDVVTISSIINQGLISRGRIMCFGVELPDKPGQLVKVAKIVADNMANVIELQHNQFKAIDRYSNKVMLEVTVETNGHEHIKQLIESLEENNFIVNRIY